MGSNSKKVKAAEKAKEMEITDPDEEWGTCAKFSFYFWAFVLRLVFIYIG